MRRTCLRCQHVNETATGGELEACPACGAIYSRVEAAAARGALRPVVTASTTAPPVDVVEPSAPTAAPPPPPSRAKGADEKFCQDCGSIINVKAEICPKCGVRQMAAPVAAAHDGTLANGRNKTTAGLLALFLGGLGVHKFYLGRGFQGVLYLVFCWTFIPAFFGLIEGLNYLLMSQQTFAARYGT